MKKCIPFALIITLLSFFQVSAQSEEEFTNVEEHFDLLTSDWLQLSGDLKTYNGLSRFCKEPDFRQHAVNILSMIHHYDSLILEALNDPTVAANANHREYRKTIRDIEKFEKEFSIRHFMDHLRESCGVHNDLEKNREVLRKESGMYSYDGRVLVLETELRKYLKNIEKVVVAIDDHVHMLHLNDVKSYKLLTEKVN